MKDTIRKNNITVVHVSGSMFYISDIWKCKIDTLSLHSQNERSSACIAGWSSW